MPKKAGKAPAKRKTVSKKAKQPRQEQTEPEEPELVLAQSAEVTHESGVLDDVDTVKLYYGARTPDMMSYQDKFDEWKKLGVEVTPVVSQPDGTDWKGCTGYVQDVAKEKGVSDPKSTAVLLCGMKGMAEAVKELERYQSVKDSEWPLPPGYRQRLAPSYIAHVYGKSSRGYEYAQEYLRVHGLDDCYAAQEIVSILEFFDRLLLMDKIRGFINWPNTEYAARRAYGLELAFMKCKTKNDWCKAQNAGKTWRSKVNWDDCKRLDPRSVDAGKLQVRSVEDEIRVGMERDALFAKVRTKLETQNDSAVDPLNPGSA